MAESSLGTKVPRAEYLTVPTPDPNGHDPASAPTVRITAIEEVPKAPPKDPSDAIIDAAGKLLTAARAQIAFHEARAKRLRDVCAAFAAVSAPSGGDSATLSQADAITRLLQIADTLPKEGNQS